MVSPTHEPRVMGADVTRVRPLRLTGPGGKCSHCASPPGPESYGAWAYARALRPLLLFLIGAASGARSLLASSFREITSSQKEIAASHLSVPESMAKTMLLGDSSSPVSTKSKASPSGPDGHPPRPDIPKECVPPSPSGRHRDGTP